MWERQVWLLGQEDPLRKEMATASIQSLYLRVSFRALGTIRIVHLILSPSSPQTQAWLSYTNVFMFSESNSFLISGCTILFLTTHEHVYTHARTHTHTHTSAFLARLIIFVIFKTLFRCNFLQEDLSDAPSPDSVFLSAAWGAPWWTTALI